MKEGTGIGKIRFGGYEYEGRSRKKKGDISTEMNGYDCLLRRWVEVGGVQANKVS